MNEMKHKAGPSEFKGLHGIEYFHFEEDFIEKNVRCIPMIVRFKMDAAGIKLKLAEWSKFSTEERVELALKPCINEADVGAYKKYLVDLIINRTDKEATTMEVDKCPAWAMLYELPAILIEKANEFGNGISLDQWASLTNLQRFALLKLCREGHENKNFPKAFREFGLLDKKDNE